MLPEIIRKARDMIYMERIEATARMRRFYRISVERTLFGEWALVREWGRIGSAGGQRLEAWFHDQNTANKAMAEIVSAKQRRGYAIPSDRVLNSDSSSDVVRASLGLLEEHETRMKAPQEALIAGEESGEPRAFDFEAFKARKRAEHAR